MGKTNALLPELRLRILSLLPPNDLALSGRLSCKEAAQHFAEPQYLTARLSVPLPEHAAITPWCVEAAEGMTRQLSFIHKLQLPCCAAASGCKGNVEFALQLLQPHVFPELLHTDHYRNLGQPRHGPVPDMGSPAVASGLAHLLPSLEQRCPGLVDPGRTLEAAARHCDLAGLQAAWEVLGQRLRGELAQRSPGLAMPSSQADVWKDPRTVWRRVMAAAAASPTPDAIAKMAWALEKGHAYADDLFKVEHADVCGAAAASGDLARVRWLRARGGFPWSTEETLAAMVQHAELDFIQQLEREGGYLPPVGDQAWSRRETALAAAAAARDSAAKLHWLAGRVLQPLETQLLLGQAMTHGNWEALAVLLEPEHRPPLAPPWVEPLPAEQLQQEGRRLSGEYFTYATSCGSLDMLRWMLQAGCCHLETHSLERVVYCWPVSTPARYEQLFEALRLLAAAGWPGAYMYDAFHPLTFLTNLYRPWPVWRTLLELRSAGTHADAVLPLSAVKHASAAGCEATLEAMARLGFGGTGARRQDPSVADEWYMQAAKNGDLGTLTVLRRLGVPIRAGVLERAAKVYVVPLPALKWLVEQGAPWSVKSVRDVLWLMSRDMHRRPSEEHEQVVMAWLRSLLEPAAAAM